MFRHATTALRTLFDAVHHVTYQNLDRWHNYRLSIARAKARKRTEKLLKRIDQWIERNEV